MVDTVNFPGQKQRGFTKIGKFYELLTGALVKPGLGGLIPVHR